MARRVNTKFVIILSASLVGAVAMVFLAKKLIIRPHPEQFIAAAQDAEKAGQWEVAVDNWNKAIRVSSQNPAYWNNLGIAYHEAGVNDIEVEKQHLDRSAWEQALEIDPNYVPAVKSLVAYWREELQRNPGNVDAYRQARDRAEQFVSLAPDDPITPDTQAFVYTTDVEGWLGGLDTDENRVNDAEQKMRALLVKQPGNAEIVFYLALLDMRRGQLLVRGSEDTAQRPAVTRLFQKAATDVANGLKGQDQNAPLHFRAAQIYALLSEQDRSAPENHDKYMALEKAQMDAAVSQVKAKDPRFVEIMIAASRQAFITGQPDLGKSILARFIAEEAKNPMELVKGVPLMAQSSDQRDEGINLLTAALNSGPKTAEINTRQFIVLEGIVTLQVAKLEETIAHAAGSTGADPTNAPLPDDPATKTLIAQINDNIQRMSDSQIDPSQVLRVKSRLALTEHDNIGVIQILTKGMSSGVNGADPELNWELTQAYFAVNERAMAVDSCKKVIAANPNALQARKMLVRLLTGVPTDEARRVIDQQLDALQHAAPDDPDVLSLQVAQLDPEKDIDRIHTLYAQMPEKNPHELLAKAVIALKYLKDSNESARVLNKAVDMNPDDARTMLELARVLAAAGHVTEAQVAVQRGLAMHPDDKNLEFVLRQLQNASPEELAKLQSQIIAQNSTPVQKQVDEATAALEKNDYEAAAKYLQEASAINPEDKDVLDRYFRLYTQTHQWDKLDPIIKKLADTNYDQAHGVLYQFEAAKAKKDADRMLAIGVQLTSDLPEFGMSYYCLGQAYQAKHEYRQAIENYETAMQKKGIVKDAAVMLKAEIQCDYEMNRPEVALTAIQEGERRFTDDPEFKRMEIHHEMQHGQPDAAVAQLLQMLQANGNVPDEYMDLAGAEMQIAVQKLAVPDPAAAGQAAIAARDALKEAIKRFPDDPRMYERLSEVLRFGGDYKDAEQVLHDLDNRPAFATDAEPQDDLGQFYTAMGQDEKARGAFEEAMHRARASQKPGISVRYAALLAKLGKFDQALEILTPAGPDDYEVGRQRANVLVMAGRYPEAEDELKTLLANNPPDPSLLHVAWAELELNTGKRASAMEHVATALSLDPHSVPGLVMRAQLKMGQQPPDWEGALQDLNVARLVKPDDMQMLTSLCDVYLYRLQADQAAQVLETALHNDPTNLDIRFRLAYVLANYQPVQLDQAMAVLKAGVNLPGGDRNADLFNDISNVYEQQGDPGQALSTVAEALNHLPGNPTLIRTYLRLLLRNKQYANAVSASSTVLKNAPNVWWALQTKGQAEAAIGDKASGLRDLTAALIAAEGAHDITDAAGVVAIISHDIDSAVAVDLVRQRVASDPQWEFTLILLYHHRGDDASAVAELEPFLAAGKNLPAAQRRARLQLAGIIYSEAQPKPYGQKAYDVYKQILDLSPDDVAVLNNFACVCADDFSPPKVEDGLGAIRKAMEVMTSRGASDPNIEDTYGWLMILSGQTSDGMQVLQKAVSRDPFADGYYHLGEGYLRMNRPQDAQAQVNLALDAVSKAEAADKPVSTGLKTKIEDLSSRILNSLRTSSSGNLP